MNKVEKNELIDLLDGMLNENKNFYLADISGLTAEESSSLRRLCYKREVSLKVVKNTLLKKAFEKNSGDFTELYDILVGNTSIMSSISSNLPAKVIKEFRKKNEKPILKAAHIEETFYIGDEHLATLADLKSKDELIGDIITLLQSPAKNVISALQSSGSKLTSIVETLKTSNSANVAEDKVEDNAESQDSEVTEDKVEDNAESQDSEVTEDKVEDNAESQDSEVTQDKIENDQDSNKEN